MPKIIKIGENYLHGHPTMQRELNVPDDHGINLHQ